jgi:guanylate kinase
LKLRESNKYGKSLIYYERLSTPELKRSDFILISLDSEMVSIGDLMSRAIGKLAVVRKQRESLELEASLINLDEVEGLGQFLELEVDVSKAGGLDKANEKAEDLVSKFMISSYDMVPWSYLELTVMYTQSRKWRKKLHLTKDMGLVFLFDGVSCSGKTTLVRRLAQDCDLDVRYVPRYCTRKPRDRGENSEYIFISSDRFNNLATSGAFIEYRDFEFGMSYGLPWKQVIGAAMKGRSSIGIINLGNIGHVKRILPEAVTVLIDAPLETINKRLVKRGSNTREQIRERIENARSAGAFRKHYDHIVENDDGMLDSAYQAIKKIILSYRPAECRD